MPASTPALQHTQGSLGDGASHCQRRRRGCRFFLVPICNEHEMYEGVSSTRLPPRSGTGPLDFSITTFNHVAPASHRACRIGYIYNVAKPSRPLEAWWDEIWRIQLGTMAVPAPWISAIKAVAYIGGHYSMHRSLLGKNNAPTPILASVRSSGP